MVVVGMEMVGEAVVVVVEEEEEEEEEEERFWEMYRTTTIELFQIYSTCSFLKNFLIVILDTFLIEIVITF